MITLAAAIAYWAHARHDAEAVVFEDTRYTWGQFNERARSVAAGLQASGVAPGDRVAILLNNSAEWAVAFAAVTIAGGVIVPLNPRFGRFELREIEADAECRILISTRRESAHLIDRFAIDEDGADTDIAVAPRRESSAPTRRFAELAAQRRTPAEIRIAADALVAIFYTSGTTGSPKGTIHTHASIQAYGMAQTLGLKLTSDDRVLLIAPMAFTGTCLVRFIPTLMTGGCTVIAGAAYDPPHTLDLLDREKINIFSGVPTLLERLPTLPGFQTADLSKLRIGITGGAPVPLRLLHIFHAKGVVLRQVYGCTEGGGMLCFPTEETALSTPSTTGRPQLGLEVVTRAHSGGPCATDEIGEVWLRGAQVMQGYWRNAAATQEAFSDGWYKTGDLGFIDEGGNLTIVDRLKNMIISGGVNIYPAEVEQAFYAIKDVREVGVFGAADHKWGERVIAIVHGPESLRLNTLRAEARTLLGAFKTPREIVLSPHPLPRTVTNKISRSELPAFYVTLTGDRTVEPRQSNN